MLHGRGLAIFTLSAAATGGLATPSLAAIDPLSGIDFAHISAPGNAPWAGNGTVGDLAIGRGGVGYEYDIGRFEVTTAQWTEFFNAAYDRPASDQLPHLLPPTHWGAVATTPTVPGGQRWTVPAGNAMLPVGNISWRMAAMYCNWLCNNKSTDRAAFLNGAYDVSTFVYSGNGFLDQSTHTPGARYWIPTLDEWIKAAHYDPNKNGPGQGGYWVYSITRDTAPVPGPPPSLGGTGDANFGFTNGPVSPFSIPLGAYAVTSPWGLYDMAGGTSEWTEGVQTIFGENRARYYLGSWWTASPGFAGADAIYGFNSDFPSLSTYDLGFRIASSVPAPGPCTISAGVLLMLGASSRKPRPSRWTAALAAVVSLVCATVTRADIDPLSGIDFAHISAAGNAPWAGNGTVGDLAIGRGGVSYEYNIGKFEVTTAQWTEFFNAAFDRAASDRLPYLIPPTHWGAVPATPTVPGGQRWSVPAGNGMLPVGNISWQMAAMYSNWLCSGKSTARAAFLSGAYDVSTFGTNGNAFTDQPTHTPGARYWIPTLDEWIKAAHYDPNRNGTGQGGYWIYSITRDTAPVPGPPPSMGGTGEANFGFTTGPVSPFSIPLGAYANITSPWGLYDVAGATAEWTEGISGPFGASYWRDFRGPAWTDSPGNSLASAIYYYGSDFPSLSTYDLGFRIASSVPAPGLSTLGVGVLTILGASTTRRRR